MTSFFPSAASGKKKKGEGKGFPALASMEKIGPDLPPIIRGKGGEGPLKGGHSFSALNANTAEGEEGKKGRGRELLLGE